MKEKHLADVYLNPILESALGEDFVFVDSIRNVARGSVLPLADKMEIDKSIPDDLVRTMAYQGLFGFGLPEKYQGMGKGITGASLVALEMGYGDLSASLVPIATASLFGKAVEVGGNEKQREHLLPRIASGGLFGCYALTEPIGSSFARYNKTTARKSGDSWILNGTKYFITEAERADLAVVYARDADNLEETLAFVVPNSARNKGGYVVTGKENKMGIHASATCTLTMDDVEVPKEWLLGIGTDKERRGYSGAIKTLGNSRPTIAAQSIGNAWHAVAYLMQFANETARGDGTMYLTDIDAYNSRLAQLVGRLQESTAYLFSVTQAMDRGDIGKDAALRVPSSMLKAYGTQAAAEVCITAMTMMGGAGYLTDYPMQRLVRDSLVTPIYEGHNDVQAGVAGKALGTLLKERRG